MTKYFVLLGDYFRGVLKTIITSTLVGTLKQPSKFYKMEKFVFLTNENSNKGYSTTVKALAAVVTNPVILDAEYLGNVEIPADAIVVSAGNMGYDLFKTYGRGQEFILATDRYGCEELDVLNAAKITIIAPQCELDQYAAATAREVSYVAADLVACPERIVLEERVNFFKENNPEVAAAIANAEPEAFFFFGGRVSAPTPENPDNWKENTVEQFEAIADELMNEAIGDNFYVIFHGFRSRTRGDKSNDFGPQNAAINMMSSRREEGQTVLVLATTEEGPTLIVLNDEGETRLPVKNDNACGYYAAIASAVKGNSDVAFTAEQMNFTNEFLTLGGDWRNVQPVGTDYGWKLTVPANEATHESVFNMLRKGKTPLTQVDAFKMLL